MPQDSKAAILGRVRAALRTPTSPQVMPPKAALELAESGPARAEAIRRSLPTGGENYEESKALFAEQSAALKTRFVPVPSLQAAGDELARMAAEHGWSRLGAHAGELVTPLAEKLGLETVMTDGGYDPNELERCEVGLTECDALVAQTGSVLVTTRSAGGRALSVLPPHHVVVARKSQLIGALVDAYELLESRYGDAYPSFMTFITGPSRTGDIERILVLGAHGPKELTVLLIEG
ncbi:Lactate utilization protein C [Pseudobythopirellula maris]|uniref:Lactate utilization protein C n=1 Tax=Pseudobythopirellula maris TaxID=2527991 RepID=A0A5C5ZL67_9BACT|nr:lactate utilization protein [Pseudobythopirellula maris]TWT87173.1 Lactate utilization protein C [Pseudobythopirellula maris]